MRMTAQKWVSMRRYPWNEKPATKTNANERRSRDDGHGHSGQWHSPRRFSWVQPSLAGTRWRGGTPDFGLPTPGWAPPARPSPACRRGLSPVQLLRIAQVLVRPSRPTAAAQLFPPRVPNEILRFRLFVLFAQRRSCIWAIQGKFDHSSQHRLFGGQLLRCDAAFHFGWRRDHYAWRHVLCNAQFRSQRRQWRDVGSGFDSIIHQRGRHQHQRCGLQQLARSSESFQQRHGQCDVVFGSGFHSSIQRRRYGYWSHGIFTNHIEWWHSAEHRLCHLPDAGSLEH